MVLMSDTVTVIASYGEVERLRRWVAEPLLPAPVTGISVPVSGCQIFGYRATRLSPLTVLIQGLTFSLGVKPFLGSQVNPKLAL